MFKGMIEKIINDVLNINIVKLLIIKPKPKHSLKKIIKPKHFF